MKRDLSQFTSEEIESLAKEIWEELREEHKGLFGHGDKETIKTIDEWYPEETMIAKTRSPDVIKEVISWFVWLRFDWKYTIGEAKDTLGDALTISTNLDESIFQCYDEKGEYKEDLDFDSGDHIFVGNVLEKIRNRGLKVYRRKRMSKRRELPKEKIRKLRKEGYTIREIAKILEIPKSTIGRVLKEK